MQKVTALNRELASGAGRLPDDLIETWRASGLRANVSLAAAMAKAVADHPGSLLHIHSSSGAREATLAQVHEDGARIAGSLQALGVKAGDVLAMQLPNCLENATLFQAAAALGCVILPIVHIFGPSELAQILEDSGAVAFVTPERWRNVDFMDRWRRLPQLPRLKHRIVIGAPSDDGIVAWRDLSGGPFREADDADPDAPAMLLYTSGTTARPKGVLHSSNTILSELLARWDEEGPRSWLSPWPSGHVAGTLAVLQHSVLGRPMVVMDAWDPAAAAMLIERFAVSQTSGTPFHLAGLLDAAARDGRNLSSLSKYIIGATTVPPSVVQASETIGIRCCRAYGSTEMPTLSQCSPDDPLDRRLQSDGRLNPGCDLRIIDDEGRDVAQGVEGELAVRGPERFLGYTDPDLDAGAFLPGGWFLTGDIGKIDPDGYLTITDRKKDIIIRGGENISSREVEELLLAIPGIRDAAAIGYADARFGERVCAVLMVEPGFAPTVATLDAAFQSMGVARQKTPERIVILDDLPRTPTGKVNKAQLRQRLSERA